MKELIPKFWKIILEKLPNTWIRNTIEKQAVTPRYTGIKLSNGVVGLAYSHTREEWCQPEVIVGKDIRSILPSLLASTCTPTRALGQAIVNALGQEEMHSYNIFKKIDMDEIIREAVSIGKPVVFVGEIKKIPNIVVEKGGKIFILERNPRSQNVLQDYYDELILPRAGTVFLTGSAFARPDIDRVLELAKNSKILVLVGPSSSLPPIELAKVLKELNFINISVYIASIKINNYDKVFELVSAGQGHRTFSSYADNIVIKIL